MRAGVVPALKASGQQWSTVVVRPGRSPMAAFAYALTPMLSTTTSGIDTTAGTTSTPAADLSQQQAIVEHLNAEPGYLGAGLRSRARSRNQHILLFIDQFEELYTQATDPSERLAFTACLAGVCDDVTTPVQLVLSLRSDFLDHFAAAPAFMAKLTQGLFSLTPPNRDGLRNALIQPTGMAGYQLEAPSMTESHARSPRDEARVRAETAKSHERRSRRHATEAARFATESEARAEQAIAELAAMLANEQKCVREPGAQTRGSKIIPDVTLK
ncbi:MAG TPA: hypothetical protein VHN14_28870 [Kofleriaceae bacterium]|nr:hypothetical protein [Kofleriaceae bacterium]